MKKPKQTTLPAPSKVDANTSTGVGPSFPIHATREERRKKLNGINGFHQDATKSRVGLMKVVLREGWWGAGRRNGGGF
jgi:hypothetical protein